MPDLEAIRRANFAALCNSRGWTPAKLGDRESSPLGWGRVSYWRDLLSTKPNKNGETKSFGEKVARRIEEAAGIPLDSLDSAEFVDSSAGVLPLRDREDALLAAWRALRPEDRDQALTNLEELVLRSQNATSDALEKLKLLRRMPDELVDIPAAPQTHPAASASQRLVTNPRSGAKGVQKAPTSKTEK